MEAHDVFHRAHYLALYKHVIYNPRARRGGSRSSCCRRSARIQEHCDSRYLQLIHGGSRRVIISGRNTPPSTSSAHGGIENLELPSAPSLWGCSRFSSVFCLRFLCSSGPRPGIALLSALHQGEKFVPPPLSSVAWIIVLLEVLIGIVVYPAISVFAIFSAP